MSNEGYRCVHCRDTGHVCENHPEFPWEGLSGPIEEHADCGGAGMPCGYCCSPIPEDVRHSIAEAFVPDHLRAGGGSRSSEQMEVYRRMEWS